jgi:hypothetical protein
MNYTYGPDVISQLRSAIVAKIKDDKYIQTEKQRLQLISEIRRIVHEKNIELFFDQLDIFVKETIHTDLKDDCGQIVNGKLTIESEHIVFEVPVDVYGISKDFQSLKEFLDKMYHDTRFISRKNQLLELLDIDIEIINVGNYSEPCFYFRAHIVVI